MLRDAERSSFLLKDWAASVRRYKWWPRCAVDGPNGILPLAPKDMVLQIWKLTTVKEMFETWYARWSMKIVAVVSWSVYWRSPEIQMGGHTQNSIKKWRQAQKCLRKTFYFVWSSSAKSIADAIWRSFCKRGWTSLSSEQALIWRLQCSSIHTWWLLAFETWSILWYHCIENKPCFSIWNENLQDGTQPESHIQVASLVAYRTSLTLVNIIMASASSC